MVRRLGLGKNNHLTYASLALNPRYGDSDTSALMWTIKAHKWLYEILKLFPRTSVMATAAVERKRSLTV